jgi:hypothetical protein
MRRPLTADQVEQAFVDAAHEQDGGPFNWTRVAVLLNERLADRRQRPAPPAITFGHPQ